MAPRRAASPAKPRRVTRARAGATDRKAADAVEEHTQPQTSTTTRTRAAPSTRKAATTVAQTSRTKGTQPPPVATSDIPRTTRTKAIESKSRVTKADSNTSRTKRAAGSATRLSNVEAALESLETDNEEAEEDDAAAVTAKPAAKTSRSTRTTASAAAKVVKSTLAAAPRRRIRVTPLDGGAAEPAPAANIDSKSDKKATAKAKKEKTASSSKPTTTRGKRDAAVAELDEKAENDVPAEPKQRGRARGRKVAASKEDDSAAKSVTTEPKPRGRPKKETAVVEPSTKARTTVPSTRQTRTRAGSAASSVPVEPTVNVVVPPRKRVTFQDPPSDEDEKENKRPATLSKARTAKKAAAPTAKSETATKGMRAKPIRNPAVAKSTKATRSALAKSSLRSINEAVQETEKSLPRVLTPKKITQVAKAVPLESEDEDEDELAGEKTPVRDLSLSPKRGIIPSMPRSASPVKKLDFATVLNATSPHKPNVSSEAGMMSPPRRLPSSPHKDILKESPRRAPEGITIFRAQVPDTNNAGSVALHPSSNQPLLHQSPKRGLTDKVIFPPSAMKSRSSPMKTALLSSPARRLFSPSKQKTPLRFSPSPKKKSPAHSMSPGDVDLVMSSHFRSSVSPQRLARVYRLSEDELAQETGQDVDFDQSLLNVRSPLKVDKATPQVSKGLDNVWVDLPHGHRLDDEASDEEEEDGLVQEDDASVAEEPLHTIEAGLDDDETMIDPTIEEEESEVDQDLSGALHDVPTPVSASGPSTAFQASTGSVKKPRLSNSLFTRMRDAGNESEDELASDQTPDNRLFRPNFRPSLTGATIRSRLSAEIGPSSATRNLEFTPLAAQVRGWHAASPEKRTILDESQPTSQSMFSPLARMHVEGSVEVNRHHTPVRQAQKRKSLASRLSFAPSMVGSPAGPEFFAESMAAKDFEDQVEGHEDTAEVQHEDLHDIVQQDALVPEIPKCEDDEDDQSEEESGSAPQDPGELTTDLINFTHASDTALVDFKALAHEAENLAGQDEADIESGETDVGQNPAVPAPALETVNEEQSMLSTSSEIYGDENALPTDPSPGAVMVEDIAEVELRQVNTETDTSLEAGSNVDKVAQQGRYDPLQADQDIVPTTEVDLFASAAMTPAATTVLKATEEMDFNITPIRPDPSLPRYVHTVSKVPLRPEGEVSAVLSPLKAQRKRSRSLSSSNAASTIPFSGKRRSLGTESHELALATPHLEIPKTNLDFGSSPQRRSRSAAPSPAHSMASQVTTPGQMSFAIDDFGDSTLDGIELPSDELTSDEMETSYATDHEAGLDQEDTVNSVGSALFKTPTVPTQRYSLPSSSVRSNQTKTPHYAMSTKSSKRRSVSTPIPSTTPTTAKTPATITKGKTPSTLLKSKIAAKTPQASRTPLKPMGEGILHGAVVHYDIHTTEGADASGVFVELLTAMGARCVKEWRWNPRASLAVGSGDAQSEHAAVGITHVVYKDGGKRTLEKVRSANGQVLCVGVGWVLDCYREGKWLDESAYTVDSSILPRGGSRRRKSMEPRMLIKENGLLSSTKENRRLTWADHMGMTEAMKMDLINTPVRGRQEQQVAYSNSNSHTHSKGHSNSEGDPSYHAEVEVAEEIGLETSFASSYDQDHEDEYGDEYDSPAAATVGEDGETANVRYLMSDQDSAEDSDMISKTPLPLTASRGRQMGPTTPSSTSLTVDYDPRTAATPMTPYLLAKGKDKGREAVPMSAPPKQLNQGIFDGDEGEDDGGSRGNANANGSVNGNGRKFQVKMTNRNGNNPKAGGLRDARRRTLGSALGFQPVVGSPLRKE